MLGPVGPKGGSGEFHVTNAPSRAKDISEVAQDTMENAVFKAKDFEAGKKIPNRKEAKTAEELAFEFFEGINEANAKP